MREIKESKGKVVELLAESLKKLTEKKAFAKICVPASHGHPAPSLREPLPLQGHQRPHDPHDTQKDRGHPLLSFAHSFSPLSFRSQAAPPKARSDDGSKII